MVQGIFSEPGPGVVVVEVVAVGWRPAEGWISKPYVLEVASLIGDLLVAVSTPYLKIIVAFVVPGDCGCVDYTRKIWTFHLRVFSRL